MIVIVILHLNHLSYYSYILLQYGKVLAPCKMASEMDLEALQISTCMYMLQNGWTHESGFLQMALDFGGIWALRPAFS